MSWRASMGLRAWTMQRLSAIYMMLFCIYAWVTFITREANDYDRWIAWVAHPFNNIVIGLFVVSLLIHAWVGSRDIILDYVKPFAFRMVKLVVLAFLIIAMALWALRILLRVAVN